MAYYLGSGRIFGWQILQLTDQGGKLWFQFHSSHPDWQVMSKLHWKQSNCKKNKFPLGQCYRSLFTIYYLCRSLPWGYEYQTSVVFKWSKRGWKPNGLVLKCNLIITHHYHFNTGQIFSYVLVQYLNGRSSIVIR